MSLISDVRYLATGIRPDHQGGNELNVWYEAMPEPTEHETKCWMIGTMIFAVLVLILVAVTAWR